jgi:serine/threonine-protein kinase
MSRTRDPAAVERFLREARAAAAVGNPYVVRILARSSPQAIPPFIVMELVEGDDLSRLLRTEGPLSVHHALRIGLQLLDGLQAVHDAGVIHRDLKPANVLLTPEGEVKLLDFGVSLLRSGRGQLFRTPQNATVGTPAYMAPEQLRSSSNADERTDVYSVSAMLFEMLTGKTPRRASTLAEHIAQASQQPVPRLAPLRPDVDPALERVIVRGLATDRDGRWASAEALAHGLISTLNAGDSGDERHPVTPGPMRKDRSRR